MDDIPTRESCILTYQELWFSELATRKDDYGNYFIFFQWAEWLYKIIKNWIEIDSLKNESEFKQKYKNWHIYYVTKENWVCSIKIDWDIVTTNMKNIFDFSVIWDSENCIRYVSRSENWIVEVNIWNDKYITEIDNLFSAWCKLYTSPNGKFFYLIWVKKTTGIEPPSPEEKEKNLINYTNIFWKPEFIDIDKKRFSRHSLKQCLLTDNWNSLLYSYEADSRKKGRDPSLIFNWTKIFDWEVILSSFDYPNTTDGQYEFMFQPKKLPIEWMGRDFLIDSKWTIFNFTEGSDANSLFLDIDKKPSYCWIKKKWSDSWVKNTIIDNKYVEINWKKYSKKIIGLK